MLTYTISVSIRSTLLRYSLFFSEYLSNHSNHSTRPDTRPDTINTRPRRRPSVQLETDRPGIEANSKGAFLVLVWIMLLTISCISVIHMLHQQLANLIQKWLIAIPCTCVWFVGICFLRMMASRR